ncbi:hypothetical protein FC83_GL000188 [Agrilactobacillus composti DSM 18527 = JCM 14202]|uniref:Surface layer protein A domain-containing protein n=1 Tax=Agrilactobacillus composti DSM 18527 = JCM 14202 TaxID=1423734 RepID=A0A0R1XVQ4_9LACO|nr:hypothetical protein [Agrilactobacillus composti]KRM32788.1 hypothetical protein FC83_GL000188 [Agrilactobacillus composti DSM 18527 = JCM 14202]
MKSIRFKAFIATLTTLLLLPLLLYKSETVQAYPATDVPLFYSKYDTLDTYYPYQSVATVNGQWGANLFDQNTPDKQFDRVLPVNSQWQIYGYTRRTDGYYFDVGGDQWVQADQVKVPVSSADDAQLNVLTHDIDYIVATTDPNNIVGGKAYMREVLRVMNGMGDLFIYLDTYESDVNDYYGSNYTILQDRFVLSTANISPAYLGDAWVVYGDGTVVRLNRYDPHVTWGQSIIHLNTDSSN